MIEKRTNSNTFRIPNTQVTLVSEKIQKQLELGNILKSNIFKSSIPIESFTKDIEKAIKHSSPAITVLSKAYANYMQTMIKAVSESFPKIELPEAILPKIENFGNFKDKFKDYKYLFMFREAEWPLYFVNNENLQRELDCIDIKDENWHADMTDVVMNYYNTEGIDSIVDWWWNNPSIPDERRKILAEAIKLHKNGYYYGSVAIIMSQIFGMINSIYKKMVDAGVEFDQELYELLHEQYNGKPLSNPDKKRINKSIQENSIRGERNQLLCISTEIDEAALLWDSVLKYIFKVVLTSDDALNDSNHPCRNKICHGVQQNFGTKEHSLKAILSVDMLLVLEKSLINSL